jgi:hypothetical protein
VHEAELLHHPRDLLILALVVDVAERVMRCGQERRQRPYGESYEPQGPGARHASIIAEKRPCTRIPLLTSGFGGLAEWSIAAVLKTARPLPVSRVRIPDPPPVSSGDFVLSQFLAIYMGDVNAAKTDLDPETVQKGMAAWGEWMQRNAARVVYAGGPLGRTKLASKSGVEDIRNAMTGFVIVQAESLEEAARLFENHPHFAIFPGKGVEVMECLPMPPS